MKTQNAYALNYSVKYGKLYLLKNMIYLQAR